jgi:hypothetical protein
MNERKSYALSLAGFGFQVTVTTRQSSHMTKPSGNSSSAPGWQPIPGIDGVFEIRRSHGPLPLRAVAVQLHAGSVCVYSPVPHMGEPALRQLGSWGKPLLLAPNAFHTLGLSEHAAAFGNTEVIASKRAADRIKRKTKLDVQDLDVLRNQLPAEVSLLELPPVRSGEVWLSVHRNGRCAWIVCDGFLNLARAPSGALGVFIKLMRMGPGLSISSTFRWMVKNRQQYRNWLLERIAADRPTVLVPCHGQIIDDPDLPARLERLMRERL